MKVRGCDQRKRASVVVQLLPEKGKTPITLRSLTVDCAIENRYSRISDSLLPAQMLTWEEKLQ